MAVVELRPTSEPVVLIDKSKLLSAIALLGAIDNLLTDEWGDTALVDRVSAGCTDLTCAFFPPEGRGIAETEEAYNAAPDRVEVMALEHEYTAELLFLRSAGVRTDTACHLEMARRIREHGNVNNDLSWLTPWEDREFLDALSA
ncbi:MAG TPA: hypothetical protein VFM96_10175 [Gaiellaceae bacterium]|nr:hypothetical protein [Gaiellaceae bacterium]